MASKKQVTIQRVAHEADVSTMTVSRVINQRPDVSPDTRRRVQRVITRLGYHPNNFARSLASSRSHTLGLITADFSDFFFTEVIAGAEAEARKHGYFFMLGSTERNLQDEPEYIRLLTQRHVDGILFARPSTEPDYRHLQSLIRKGTPVVTTSFEIPGEKLTVVDVDNADGAQQAINCLLAGGHRHIAMITGPESWKSVADRSRGYQSALKAAGIPFKPALVVQGDWSYDGGYRAAQELLARSKPFTGLFAQNDRMAIGAMRALREAGRQIPRDVSVIGYDDIPVAAFSDPPLTTVRQPMRQVGAVATRLLIQAIEEPELARHEDLLLGTELIQRGSTAASPDSR